MIPVNATRGGTITYNDPDPQKWFYTGSQNFTGQLDFYLTAGVNNTLANVQGSVGDLKNNVNSTLGEFSSANAMNASSEFLNYNSIIAKFGFLLLVLIAFLGLMRVGMLIIAFIFKPAKQTYLVKGLLRGSVPVTNKQDPADTK
jgi:hypothetical protein